jgi:hypothetical protein
LTLWSKERRVVEEHFESLRLQPAFKEMKARHRQEMTELFQSLLKQVKQLQAKQALEERSYFTNDGYPRKTHARALRQP